MATINAPASERRHLSDRRTTGSTHKVKLNAIDWIAMVLIMIVKPRGLVQLRRPFFAVKES